MTTYSDPLANRLAEAVRSRLAGGRPAADAENIRRVLREMDAFGFEAPVGVQGYDLGLTSGAVIAAELGRCVAPDVYSAVATAVDGLAGMDDPSGRAVDLCAGASAVRFAAMDTGATLRGSGLTGVRGVEGWSLTGQVVRDAEPDATNWLVPFEAGGRVRLALVGDERCRPPRLPGREHLTVDAAEVDRLEIGDRDVVGRLGSGASLSDEDGVLARARVRHAAYLWGLSEHAYELAVGYAGRRSQFGQPLREFQGISFPLARARVALTAVRHLVFGAAGAADRGEPVALAAVQALAQAAETALTVVRSAVQVHGARGLATETPVHRCYLRVRAEATRFGRPEALWREAGARRMAGESDPRTLAMAR